MLPVLYDALAKGSDPDRMKGALYVLWNKGTGRSLNTLRPALVNLPIIWQRLTHLLVCYE